MDTVIYRDTFMSVIGEKQPNQNETNRTNNRYRTDTEPIQNRTKSDELTLILGAIKKNPFITMDALSDLLKITKSSVQRRLETLVKEGKLRHVGSTKGGYWKVIIKP